MQPGANPAGSTPTQHTVSTYQHLARHTGRPMPPHTPGDESAGDESAPPYEAQQHLNKQDTLGPWWSSKLTTMLLAGHPAVSSPAPTSNTHWMHAGAICLSTHTSLYRHTPSLRSSYHHTSVRGPLYNQQLGPKQPQPQPTLGPAGPAAFLADTPRSETPLAQAQEQEARQNPVDTLPPSPASYTACRPARSASSWV